MPATNLGVGPTGGQGNKRVIRRTIRAIRIIVWEDTSCMFVMGLITNNERDRIDAVRRVRNVFAHEANAGFSHPEIKKMCSKPVVNAGRITIRDEFLQMALNVVLPLLYRDLKVSVWRRPELTQEVVNGWFNDNKSCAP